MLSNCGAGEDSWESLYCKKIKPVNLKGSQPWIFIGRTDAEAEAPILWPPVAKSQLIGKDPDAGKDWRQEEKGTTEDEMVGWHNWLNGLEFDQTQGDSERQGNLVCCSSWVAKSRTRLSSWKAMEPRVVFTVLSLTGLLPWQVTTRLQLLEFLHF